MGKIANLIIIVIVVISALMIWALSTLFLEGQDPNRTRSLNDYGDITEIRLQNGNTYKNKKFLIDGENLYYDEDFTDVEEDKQITEPAAEILRYLLREYEIRTLFLNSRGGSMRESQEMASLIDLHDLDTVVTKLCASGCTYLFLEGKSRKLEEGAKLGFHRSSSMNEDLEKRYYELKGEFGEDYSVFDFAAALTEETQEDMFIYLNDLLEKGIDPAFAIKTFQASSDDMWYPSREELIAAGVLAD